MSVSIAFGEERKGQPYVQVATNKGWIDLLDWGEKGGSVKNDELPCFAYFLDHFECIDIAGMIAEIENLLEASPPDDPTVLSTLGGLLETLKQNESEPFVYVSDGFYSGYNDSHDPDENDESDDDESEDDGSPKDE